MISESLKISSSLYIIKTKTAFNDEIIIVDNFYENPEIARQKMLRSEFKNNLKKFFGETELIESVSLEKDFVNLGIQLFNAKFDFLSFFAKVTTNESWPHIDKYPVAGVVYFNTDQESDGGTGFYKHKETGVYKVDYFKGFPNYKKAALLSGYESEKEFADAHFCDRSKWEIYELIPMKFNRLIIYSSGLYHNSHFNEGYYSKSLPRLTQNFFFKLPDQ